MSYKPTIIGTSNKLLDIDLTSKQYTIITIKNEDIKLYLGGKGLALYYLYKNLNFNCDALSAENIIAIFTGPVVGTGAPNSARFSAVTKSPLTNIIVSSSSGGSFGEKLRTAGYDGLLIRGKASSPIYIEIYQDKVEFHDAKELWGKDIKETQDKLKKKEKSRGILAIGPAGENLVLFANVASDERFFGRGGIGAVFGSKNLKAIVANGNHYKIIAKNEKKFKKVKKKALKYIKRNSYTSSLYHKYGTNINIKLCNEGGLLPVRNFTGGKSDKYDLISGETYYSKYQNGYSSCKFCPIQCGHKGNFDGKELSIPEYETTSLFGSNLEIYDPLKIAEWNEICGRLGLDTISTAVTLAYAMEAGEKRLLETDLRFGLADNISKTLENIAYRQGFGDELANGTRWLAKKYGGEEFAINIKGLEMAGYDPRGSWGQALSYSVANRGACHVSASIFTLDNFEGYLKPQSTRAKAEFTWFFENLFATINSIPTCLFTSMAYIMETPLVKKVPKFLLQFTMRFLPSLAIKLIDVDLYRNLFISTSGIRISKKQFIKAGERIHYLERYMNSRMGINWEEDTLPQRFLKEGRTTDPKKETVPLEKMLRRYYKIRGYNNYGIPKAKKLKGLSIPISKIQPKEKKFKKAVIRIVFSILGKTLQTLSRLDKTINKEISTWPDDTTIMLKVNYYGPALSLIKTKKNHLKVKKLREKEADIIIYFKNTDAAFDLMTAKHGIHQAYAMHRLYVKGDLSLSMSLIRCINIAETYLFPSFIAKRIMRKLPHINIFKKNIVRLYLYLLTITFGL